MLGCQKNSGTEQKRTKNNGTEQNRPENNGMEQKIMEWNRTDRKKSLEYVKMLENLLEI